MAANTSFLAIIFCFCFVTNFQLYRATSSGFSLKLIPIDHPDSPLYVANTFQVEKMVRLNEFSEARASYLLSLATRNSTPLDLKEVGFTLKRISFYYVVELEFGDPPITLYLLVDTGSDLTWIKCQHPSSSYNPRTSFTYHEIRTDDPTCSGPNAFFKNVNNQCVYSIKFDDGSFSDGLGSTERIRVSSDRVLENVIFGCSTSNQLRHLQNDKISGVMGLGDSRVSMMSQFSDITKGKYSYCFRSQYAEPDHFYLTFGDNIPVNLTQVFHTISIVRSSFIPRLFYLNVVDISVGKIRMNLSSYMFRRRPDGTGGLLIDSGTSIPRLDATAGRDVYAPVIAQFQTFYDSRGLVRFHQVGDNGYKLCYKYDDDFDDYASMTYHFGGGNDNDYVVDKKFTNVFSERDHYFCVALVAGKGYSILGAWHQQNMRLIFYVDNSQLQYAEEIC